MTFAPKTNHVMPMLELDMNDPQSLKVLKALASEARLRILDLLGTGPYNVTEIAEALDMPISTANLHLNVLDEAGLLVIDLKPGIRGTQKVCSKAYATILLPSRKTDTRSYSSVEVMMPLGAYVDCEVAPTCGLYSETGAIGYLDQPTTFYEPDRIYAQRLWFHHGYVEYRFPNRLPPKVMPDSLHLSMEVCSETVLHHYDWPSDITVWINQTEIATWTSPADFGGVRGLLTPEWTAIYGSQYGLLKVWRVDKRGTFIDGTNYSNVTLSDLDLMAKDYIAVRIGVKPDAHHVGGINIFGRKFGNHPQDIVLNIYYV